MIELEFHHGLRLDLVCFKESGKGGGGGGLCTWGSWIKES